MDFNEANAVVHPVEKQWHYPIMTKHGFIAETKEQTGFVRHYIYAHPDGRRVVCKTGSSSDYWYDEQTNATGYWATLEKHVGGIHAA